LVLEICFHIPVDDLKGLSNFFVITDDMNLQELFIKSSFVVGVHSTFIYTALQARKKVCIYKILIMPPLKRERNNDNSKRKRMRCECPPVRNLDDLISVGQSNIIYYNIVVEFPDSVLITTSFLLRQLH
jgi:hypothetical protein